MKHDAHTFKHAGYTAQAHSAAPGEFALNVWWTNEDSAGRQAILPTTDAPALALAILEAAGHGGSSESSRLMQAFDLIELHVKEQERATAEAKEQAELEAEALELANSAVLVVGNPPYPSIGHMSDTSLRKWLAVARKAREMAKEATK